MKIQEGYAELKTDLLSEVNLVDERIVKPATEAKDHIQPLKKVIKQREDRKVQILPHSTRKVAHGSPAGFRKISKSGRQCEEEDKTLRPRQCGLGESGDRLGSGQRGLFACLPACLPVHVDRGPFWDRSWLIRGTWCLNSYGL